MGSTGYFARAARSVFGDRTLWWRILALAVVGIVPLLGSLVQTGYMMVIMRDAAWSIDRGLPAFSERDQIFRQGLVGLLVSLVWGLALAAVLIVPIIIWVVVIVTTGTEPTVPWWFGVAISVFLAPFIVFMYVAFVRSAVYQKVSPGLSVSGVRQLIAANRSGFKGVALPAVAVGLLSAALSAPSPLIVRQLETSAFSVFVFPYAWAFLLSLFTLPLHLTIARSYGLWAAETDPASWPPLEPAVEAHNVVPDEAIAAAQQAL